MNIKSYILIISLLVMALCCLLPSMAYANQLNCTLSGEGCCSLQMEEDGTCIRMRGRGNPQRLLKNTITTTVSEECRNADGCPSEDLSVLQPHIAPGPGEVILPSPPDPGFGFGNLCSLLGGFSNMCVMLLDCVADQDDCPITNCLDDINNDCALMTSQADATRCGETWNGNNQTSSPVSFKSGVQFSVACAELCTLDPGGAPCAMLKCIATPGPACCAVTPIAECCDIFDLAEEVVECVTEPTEACCQILVNDFVAGIVQIPQSVVDMCTAIFQCASGVNAWDGQINTINQDMKDCCNVFPGASQTCQAILCTIANGQIQTPEDVDQLLGECCSAYPANAICRVYECYKEPGPECCALINDIKNGAGALGITSSDIDPNVWNSLDSFCNSFFVCYNAFNRVEAASDPCYFTNAQQNYCEHADRSSCLNCDSALMPGQTPESATSLVSPGSPIMTDLINCCDSVAGSLGTVADMLKDTSYVCKLMECYNNPSVSCCYALPPSVRQDISITTSNGTLTFDEVCTHIWNCIVDPIYQSGGLNINTLTAAADPCCNFGSYLNAQFSSANQQTSQACGGVSCLANMIASGPPYQMTGSQSFIDPACCRALPEAVGVKVNGPEGEICPAIVQCLRKPDITCCDRIFNLLKGPPFNLADADAFSNLYAIVPSCSAIYECAFGNGSSTGLYDLISYNDPNCSGADVQSNPNCGSFGLQDPSGGDPFQALMNLSPHCCAMADALLGTDYICELQLLLRCASQIEPSCCRRLVSFVKRRYNAGGCVFFGPDLIAAPTGPDPCTQDGGDGNSLRQINSNDLVQICEQLIKCLKTPGPTCCSLLSTDAISGGAAGGLTALGVGADVLAALANFNGSGNTNFGVGLESACRRMWGCLGKPTPGCCSRYPEIMALVNDTTGIGCGAFSGVAADMCQCAVSQCGPLIDCAVDPKPECCQTLDSLGQCLIQGTSLDSFLSNNPSIAQALPSGVLGTGASLILGIPGCIESQEPEYERTCYDPNSGFEGCDCQRMRGGKSLWEDYNPFGIDIGGIEDTSIIDTVRPNGPYTPIKNAPTFQVDDWLY